MAARTVIAARRPWRCGAPELLDRRQEKEIESASRKEKGIERAVDLRAVRACDSFFVFFWAWSEYDEVLIIGRLWVVGL